MQSDTRAHEPRCYFALLDRELRFRYLDPAFRASLGEQAPLLLFSTLYRWMHPEELGAAQVDTENFLRSRTLFGTVTRCRFHRPSAIRKALGATDVASNPVADLTSLDETWTQLKIVASWIGEGTVLAFFHAVVDQDPIADCNENHLSLWSNWCGPLEWDPNTFLSPDERAAISQAMIDMDRESRAAHDNFDASLTGDAPPRYVFQILTSNGSRLVLSQPSPRYITSASSTQALMDYEALDYARLAQAVWEKPRERNTEARSNCTRRFRSKHPIMKDGGLTTIESVVIRYNSICFACFQTQGGFASQRPEPVRADSVPSMSQPLPSPHQQSAMYEDHFPPTTDIASQPPKDHPMLGKRRRSRSEAAQSDHRPVPLSLAAHYHLPWGEGQAPRDGLSPTVATGAAILGSLTNSVPSGPPQQQYSSAAASYPFPSPTLSNGSDYIASIPPFSEHEPYSYPQHYAGVVAGTPTDHPPYMNGYYQQLHYSGMPQPYNAGHQMAPPRFEDRRTNSETYLQEGARYTARTGSQSLQRSQSAGASQPSPNKNQEDRKKRESSANGTTSDSQHSVASAAAANRRARRQAREAEAGRVCASCGTSNSPEWRKGPSGIKSLCNACGLRYARSVARDARKEAEAQAAAEGKPFSGQKTKKKTMKSNSNPNANGDNAPISEPFSAPQRPNLGSMQMQHSSPDSMRRSLSQSQAHPLSAAPVQAGQSLQGW